MKMLSNTYKHISSNSEMASSQDKCKDCNNALFKCNNETCDNYVKNCRICKSNAKPELYLPNFNRDRKTSGEQLYQICCGKCGYEHELLVKYNDEVPIISEMYKNMEINITFKDKQDTK